MVDAATPYESARKLFGAGIPNWLNATDAARLASYALYESIYWNNPETFKLVMRGTNENPIYVPSGRIMCNTMNRYVGRGWHLVPDEDYGDPKELKIWMKSLFKRERIMSKYNTNKLYGVIRGDAAWLITGNSDKPEGSRVSVMDIDPATVFWIEDPLDESKDAGVDLVEQLVEGDTLYVKRQRWLKSNHPDHPFATEPPTYGGEISYQVDSFEVEGWESPEDRTVFRDGPNIPPVLIAGITHLPVYCWKNTDQPENRWGSSEMRGVETMIAGVNQTISDQDLALALSGIGVYVTDAGAPVDENGNETTWGLGPGEVVEVAAGRAFTRVKGVDGDGIDAGLKHMKFLQEQMFRTNGSGDVAQGQVDVQVAESGIALALRMGPLLDEAAIKDQLIMDCMDQMVWDLRQWLDVYEGTDFTSDDPADTNQPVLVSKMGNKLPEDRAARIKTLFEGYNAIPAIFSGAYVRDEIRKMDGFEEMPTNDQMMEQIATEAAFFTDATTGVEDEYGTRLGEEGSDDVSE